MTLRALRKDLAFQKSAKQVPAYFTLVQWPLLVHLRIKSDTTIMCFTQN